MSLVKALFYEENDATHALEALRTAFPDEAISMALYRVSRVDPGDAHGYDPVDAARLAGTTVNTLSSTGINMVGNSTTLDVRLGDLGSLLEASAQDERRSSGRRTGSRIEATVECENEAAVDTAKGMLHKANGKKIRVDRAPAES